MFGLLVLQIHPLKRNFRNLLIKFDAGADDVVFVAVLLAVERAAFSGVLQMALLVKQKTDPGKETIKLDGDSW